MSEVKIVIEGADAATENLLTIPGLSGNWTAADGGTKKEAALATVATIVGIVGGTIEL